MLEFREVDYFDLAGGHWPMWSQPEALAARLHLLAGGAEPAQ